MIAQKELIHIHRSTKLITHLNYHTRSFEESVKQFILLPNVENARLIRNDFICTVRSIGHHVVIKCVKICAQLLRRPVLSQTQTEFENVVEGTVIQRYF